MYPFVVRSSGPAPSSRDHRHNLSARRHVAFILLCLLFIVVDCGAGRASETDPQSQIAAQKVYTLTVVVDGVRNSTGNIGMLIFNSRQGWPDELKSALRGATVPAEAGKTTVKVEGLPAGDYGVLVIHDENMNQKLDRDWKGIPSEQWGMSNNPKVFLSAPSFDRARFHLTGDMQIHIILK
jgi:uncharacterized protein (DUF2141 family)